MKKFSLLCVALVAGALSTACASSTPATPASGGAGATGAAAGGGEPAVKRLVLASNPPAGEDANVRRTSGATIPPMRAPYENLLSMDENTGKMVPQLAKSWQLENNGKALRMKLQEGVKFHGGKWPDFSATDVRFSWESLVTMADSHTGAGAYKSMITDVEIVSPLEVVLKVNPTLEMYNMLSNVYSQMVMRSKAHFDTEGEPTRLDQPMVPGTAPLQYLTREVGAYVRFQRVPYQHWREMPDFEEFEYRYVPEASTRLASLLAGEVHVTVLPFDLYPQVKAAGHEIIPNKVAGPRVKGRLYCCHEVQGKPDEIMNPSSPMLDVRVRQALNVAINRDEMKKAFAASGETMYLDHFHPSRPGYDAGWEKRFNELYGYNPQKARQLLADAGYGPNKPLKLTLLSGVIAYLNSGPDIADSLAGYWRSVGVDPQIVTMDRAAEENTRRTGKFDNHVKVWGDSGPIGDGVRQQVGTPWPANGFYTREMQQKFNQALVEVDEKKQDTMLREVGELGFTQFWSIPLWWVPQEAVVNSKVVKSYLFPGAVHGGWSHFENIKLVRK